MRFPISSKPIIAAVFAFACFVVSALQANATTMAQQSLSDLAKNSELIFEGAVLSSAVVPGVSGGPPHTCLTFSVTDVIAGASPGNTVVLCFKGGEVDGVRTVVSDLNIPAVGEHGIYLAESLHRTLVNPLAGWDQGRFLVTDDPESGTAKMRTAQGRPLMSLAEEARHATAQTTLLPPGAAAAGVIAGAGPDIAGAMGRDAFKTWLRSVR